MIQWQIKLLGSVSALMLMAGCSHSTQSALAPNPNMAAKKQSLVVKTENITVSKLKLLSSHGDPDAQYALGYRHFYGIGVARDTARSVQLFQSAASKGQTQAKEALRRIGHAHANLASTHRAQKKPVLYLKHQHRAKVASVQTPFHVQQGYTLQLLGASNKEQVKRFMLNGHLLHASTFYHTKRGQDDWYVVVSGHYPTRQAALTAIEHMSPTIKDLNPWVKPLSLVSKEMKLGLEQ